jgi:hypothetical protein
MDSVSKRYSMCGARVGALVTKNRAVLDTALKFAQARLSPPSFGQIAGEAALDTPDSYFKEVYQEYIARRDFMVEALNNIPGVKSHGNPRGRAGSISGKNKIIRLPGSEKYPIVWLQPAGFNTGPGNADPYQRTLALNNSTTGGSQLANTTIWPARMTTRELQDSVPSSLKWNRASITGAPADGAATSRFVTDPTRESPSARWK